MSFWSSLYKLALLPWTEFERKAKERGTFSITVQSGGAASRAINHWTGKGWDLVSNIPSGKGLMLPLGQQFSMTLVFKWPAGPQRAAPAHGAGVG